MEAPIAIRRHAARRHALRLEAAQPPEEETDIADVPPALLLGDGAHVGGVGDMVERDVQPVDGFWRTDVGTERRVRADVVAHEMSQAEQFAEFDRSEEHTSGLQSLMRHTSAG